MGLGGMRLVFSLELYVMPQPLDGLLGEVAVQGKVVEAVYWAVQAAVVYDGLCPVKADVGVAAQLVERKAVDVEPLAG